MSSLSMTKVAELMGINLHTEKPHPKIPGVVIGELGGPLYDLVQLVTQALNETGSILVSGGYPNLGSFILEALKEGERAQVNKGTGYAALETALERIVKALPAFQDMAIVDGQPIYCFKKALFLIHAIRIRFGSMSPPPFPIPLTDGSPIFTDNVIPSLLVHFGVIDLSQAPGLSGQFSDAGSEELLEKLLGPAPPGITTNSTGPSPGEIPQKVPKGSIFLSNDQAFKLRAAAIDACEMIIEKARAYAPGGDGNDPEVLAWIRNITLPDLDLWIWSVAKDRPDYRALERFAQRDTVFY